MPVIPAPNLQVVGRGLQPIWTDAQQVWCGRDLWVYRYHYESRRLQAVFRLPRRSSSLGGRLRDALARSWIKRWLRPGLDIDTLTQLPGGDLVVLFDRVYWYSPVQHKRFAEPLAHDGIEPPLAMPLRGGLAVHPASRCAYFGEYLNGNHREIRVARADVDRRQVEVCWTFARSDIKHVHAIHYDRFRNRLWVCTGDQDHESAIWYTDDEFRTLHRFGGGDQSWRAIAMLFDESGMEWGMDAGQDAPADAINRIYRHDFTTGQRSERAVIGNPAYAACELSDGTAILQTSFEPRRQQPTPAAVSLWHRGADGVWLPLLDMPYQARPRDGKEPYGHLLIPQGQGPAGQLLCTPVNTARHAGCLLHLRWGA